MCLLGISPPPPLATLYSKPPPQFSKPSYAYGLCALKIISTTAAPRAIADIAARPFTIDTYKI